MYDRTVANYQSDANVLGTVLAERKARYIQGVDQVLQELQLRVRLLDIRGPEDFQARRGTLEIHNLLRDHMQNLPPANAIILIDAEGRIASSSRGADQRGIDVPDADYMRHFATSDDVLAFQWSQNTFTRNEGAFRSFVQRALLPDGPHSFERRRPNGRVLEVRRSARRTPPSPGSSAAPVSAWRSVAN